MQTTRFLQFGWVLAAAVIGVALAGGFQNNDLKIGVVDVVRMLDQSDYGKEGQLIFKKMKGQREGILEFIDTYRVLTTDQAQRIKELSLKDTPSKEESAELDRTKADVIAANKRSVELATKPNMTPEERTLVEEYARRSQTMNDLAQRWFREFSNEMSDFADKRKLTGLTKAKAAINEVSKAQGYTVVLDQNTALYGANDLTDAALATMNAKK
jgi:Skp family chaperone for outer membrane proteins